MEAALLMPAETAWAPQARVGDGMPEPAEPKPPAVELSAPIDCKPVRSAMIDVNSGRGLRAGVRSSRPRVLARIAAIVSA